MVFKKNITSITFKFLIFILLSSILSNCSYNYSQNIQKENYNIDKIKIKAHSLTLSVNNINEDTLKDEIILSINKKLVYEFEKWASQKFILIEGESEANIVLDKAETTLTKVLKKKGITSVILHQEEKNFKLELSFFIEFKEKDNNYKKLRANANIEFILKDNSSVFKRKNIINQSIQKLVIHIDKKINDDFKGESLREFIGS